MSSLNLPRRFNEAGWQETTEPPAATNLKKISLGTTYSCLYYKCTMCACCSVASVRTLSTLLVILYLISSLKSKKLKLIRWSQTSDKRIVQHFVPLFAPTG